MPLASPKSRVEGVDVTAPNAGDCDRTRYMRGGKLLCQLRECRCGAISIEGRPPACAWCEACDSNPAIGPDDHAERNACVRGADGHCGYCGVDMETA